MPLPKAALSVLKSEGLLSFWKGNLTSVIHRFPYSAINFAVYNRSERLLRSSASSSSTSSKAQDAVIRLVCGALGGASACIACYPLDIVRTRLTAATSSTTLAYPRYLQLSSEAAFDMQTAAARAQARPPTIFSTLQDILRTDGIRGLYQVTCVH